MLHTPPGRCIRMQHIIGKHEQMEANKVIAETYRHDSQSTAPKREILHKLDACCPAKATQIREKELDSRKPGLIGEDQMESRNDSRAKRIGTMALHAHGPLANTLITVFFRNVVTFAGMCLLK